MSVKLKRMFNLESDERLEEAKIVNGNPSGIVDFVRPSRKWAKNIYDTMEANTWFNKEANVGQDKAAFNSMPIEIKEVFLKILAQLIMNDSIQTDQLVENVKPYITDPIVGQCLTRQAYEESNHSKAYATIIEALMTNDEANRVYYYQKEDAKLMKKDKAIQEMYSGIGSMQKEVSSKDFLKALAANNILENNIFYGGFAGIWSMGKTMIGSAKMISFIERDEHTHVALFKNIYRDTAAELFGGVQEVPNDIKKDILDLIDYMTGVEIDWSLYVTKDLLGFTKNTVEQYIKSKSNQICNNLGLKPLYPDVTDGGVIYNNLEKVYAMRGQTKTNFFENKVADYSKGSLEVDF